ncbi:hypothetical protein RFI_22705, partial [Reticulomyxa filosa]
MAHGNEESGIGRVLQENWNNRRPYTRPIGVPDKAEQRKKEGKKLEFKFVLSEKQFNQCCMPDVLFVINQQLMEKIRGTFRVEGLQLIVSLANGKRDLAEAISIIEKHIGEMQWMDQWRHTSMVMQSPFSEHSRERQHANAEHDSKESSRDKPHVFAGYVRMASPITISRNSRAMQSNLVQNQSSLLSHTQKPALYNKMRGMTIAGGVYDDPDSTIAIGDDVKSDEHDDLSVLGNEWHDYDE